MSGHVGREFMSLVIGLLMFIGHHQHWFLQHVAHRPRVWRHVVEVRGQLGWLLNHWPSSNKIEPGP